jgi:hypothetical protein
MDLVAYSLPGALEPIRPIRTYLQSLFSLNNPETYTFYIFNNEKRLYYLPSRVPAAAGVGGSFGCPEAGA